MQVYMLYRRVLFPEIYAGNKFPRELTGEREKLPSLGTRLLSTI